MENHHAIQLDKSTISVAIVNSKLLVYPRVNPIKHPIKSPFSIAFSMFKWKSKHHIYSGLPYISGALSYFSMFTYVLNPRVIHCIYAPEFRQLPTPDASRRLGSQAPQRPRSCAAPPAQDQHRRPGRDGNHVMVNLYGIYGANHGYLWLIYGLIYG